MSEQKDAELQKSINEIDARMYELLMQDGAGQTAVGSQCRC